MKTTVLLSVSGTGAVAGKMTLRCELWADGDALEAWWGVDPSGREAAAIALIRDQILLILDSLRAWSDIIEGGTSAAKASLEALDIASDDIALSLTFERKRFPPTLLQRQRGGADAEDGDDDDDERLFEQHRIAETVVVAAVAPGRG